MVKLLQAIHDDDGGLVVIGWVVGPDQRKRDRVQVAMAVLMLQTFAVQSCAARCTAEQKAFGSHVTCGPDQIANALEPEHRVIDVERNHIDAVRRVGSSGCIKAGHGTGFGNTLFKDLTVSGFLVVGDHVRIDGIVQLSRMSVDANFAEHPFHTKSTRFVGNDRNDVATNFRILA